MGDKINSLAVKGEKYYLTVYYHKFYIYDRCIIYLGWAHPECAEMAERSVKLYLRWIVLTHVGVTQLSRDILEAEESYNK